MTKYRHFLIQGKSAYFYAQSSERTRLETFDHTIKPVFILCLTSIEVILSSAPQREDTEGDVGLHLKVNFMDKAVHRNARLAGQWGQAENTLSFFPFAPGESFKVHFWRCLCILTDILWPWQQVYWDFNALQQGALCVEIKVQRFHFLPSGDKILAVNLVLSFKWENISHRKASMIISGETEKK